MSSVSIAQLPPADKIQSLLSNAPTLTVNLQLDAEGNLTIWSCELRKNQLHSRTIFAKYPKFADTLSPAFVDEIESQLDRLDPLDEAAKQNITTAPDFLFVTNRCILARLHITRVRRPEGKIGISVRVVSFVGRLSELLVGDVLEVSGLDSETSSLALDVFSDLLMPIMNILTLNDMQLLESGDMINCKLEEICRNSDELKMRVELLQRLIEGTGRANQNKLEAAETQRFLGVAHGAVENPITGKPGNLPDRPGDAQDAYPVYLNERRYVSVPDKFEV